MKKALLLLILSHAVLFVSAAPKIFVSVSDCGTIDVRMNEFTGFQREFSFVLEKMTVPNVWSAKQRHQVISMETSFINLSSGIYRVRCIAAISNNDVEDTFDKGIKESSISEKVEVRACDGEIPVYSKIAKNNVSQQDFRVFPNPANTEINVRLDKNYAGQNYDFSLYTITGQLLLKTKIEENGKAIDVRDLLNGIYFISIADQNTIVHQERLTINRK